MGLAYRILGERFNNLTPESRLDTSLRSFHDLLARVLSACDENLKSFAHMAVSAQVGCSWCLDFGYFHAHNEGLDERKASQVPVWRTSKVFTPLEREVMGFAEAMTATPPTVTDEQFAGLLQQIGEPAMVELTTHIALANLYTRSNVAMGIESQGFSAVCEFELAGRDVASR